MFEVIYQTRGRVFHQISKRKRRRSRVFFNDFEVFGYFSETHFRVFDMASQMINNSWRNSRLKLAKFYGN